MAVVRISKPEVVISQPPMEISRQISMGKYCVIHISETRGAIDTKFCAPRSILRFWGRSVEGVPAAFNHRLRLYV